MIVLLLSCGTTKNTEDDGNELADLPVFQSANGELSVLMEARAVKTELAGLEPETWVYQVCELAVAVNNTCPNDSRTQAPYGGVRLQVQPGDHLKIRLVNRLPSAPNDAVHMLEDIGMLAANPTNLHTHGMIVEPRQASQNDPTYGDYVYVLGYPEGLLPNPYSRHPGLDYTDKPIDYDVYVPPNHPSGLFWFHPHVHGLSLNQVSAGMAGNITVGSMSDYITDSSGKPLVDSSVKTRYLLLKDIQIEKDSQMLTQQDGGFCQQDPNVGDPPRDGFCVGQPSINDEGEAMDHTGGKWVHSINGQVFPSIHVNGGEVWRITSASGNRSYELQLKDDVTGEPLAYQVLSLDGVSLDIPKGTPDAQLRSALKNRLAPVPCPGTALGTEPVCTTTMHVMPSSRAEIYVSSATAGSATLSTFSYVTGEGGDDWPSVNLAHVFFSGGTSATPAVLQVHGQSRRVTSRDGVLGTVPLVKLPGVEKEMSLNDALRLGAYSIERPQAKMEHMSHPRAEEPNCQALPAGHHRRIFFGVPTNGEFGLGYEEVAEDGTPVQGTFKDIAAFDHTTIDVCLPLGPNNEATTEDWELINVSSEDHNFHMHQTKFRVKDGSGDTAVLIDNIAVPHGTNGCDGTVASWRSGQCQVKPLMVTIPFSQVGDFVYHCHILEHEDGGMMAHIRVVPHQ
jgi:FtsP/CotA-like multicopper oxidase with cupredoxin domain